MRTDEMEDPGHLRALRDVEGRRHVDGRRVADRGGVEAHDLACAPRRRPISRLLAGKAGRELHDAPLLLLALVAALPDPARRVSEAVLPMGLPTARPVEVEVGVEVGGMGTAPLAPEYVVLEPHDGLVGRFAECRPA